MGSTGVPQHQDVLGELLSELRRQESGKPGLDARSMLCWLGWKISAEAACVDSSGKVELCTPGFPVGVLDSVAEVRDRLARQRVTSAVTSVGDLEVRLETLGRQGPRSVLVTVSRSALTPQAAALVSYTGSVISLLRQAQLADQHTMRFERTARQLRFAVFTALMAGDPELARRMTTGTKPPVLDAETIRVHLLSCPTQDRDPIVQAYQDSYGYHGTGLMVHCPAFDEHLICVFAEGPEEGDSARRSAVLRELVRQHPEYALGVSGPHPLNGTGEAYCEALHALAIARNSPERIVTFGGRPALAHLLPRTDALTWARTFLRPLASLPKMTVDVVRLAVTFPRLAVARLLGISRNTVTAHVKRAAEVLDRDLDDVRTRAEVDLALSITSPLEDPGPGSGRSALAFEDLLATGAAEAWANSFLTPLEDGQRRDLLLTARSWIAANTDRQRTAQLLGVSRNTVRARLRVVERMLNRDLLTTGAGVHDLVHAFRIADIHER